MRQYPPGARTLNLEKAKLDPPLDYPDWPAALRSTGWPADWLAAVGATLRWHLSFSRRSRVPVCRQSARESIAQVEQYKRPSPARLERWKEAMGGHSAVLRFCPFGFHFVA